MTHRFSRAHGHLSTADEICSPEEARRTWNDKKHVMLASKLNGDSCAIHLHSERSAHAVLCPACAPWPHQTICREMDDRCAILAVISGDRFPPYTRGIRL